MRKLRIHAAATACFALAVTASASTEDELGAILSRAIEAHGGEATLLKHKTTAIHQKSHGTFEHMGGTVRFTEEVFLQPPNKSKKANRLEIGGQTTMFIMVSDGDRHWISYGGQTREANDRDRGEAEEGRNHGEVIGLLKLRERLSDLALLGESEVDGRTALGIEVRTKGHRDMQVYFDKQTGLLLKTGTWKKYPHNGQQFVEEKVLTDYRDTEGYHWPSKVVAYRDGKQFLSKEVTQFKLLDKIPDDVFAKP